MENILKRTLEKMVSLSKEAEQVLVEYVNSHGGEINISDDKDKDIIWAFVYDEIDELYLERKVTSVKTFNNKLLIQVDYPLSIEDGWYAVSGGLVLINATLFNLLDCLPEYVD